MSRYSADYGILFKQKWEDFMESMSDAQLGALIRAIMRRAWHGEIYDGDSETVKTAYSIIGTEILRDIDKYHEKCERNRQNARKRKAAEINDPDTF